MKLALVAPSFTALTDTENGGRVQLLLWEGTARDLKLTDVQQVHGTLEQSLSQWSSLLPTYERIVCVVPESHAYWFEPEVPFAQRRKLDAVLGSVLEDEWPGDIAETQYRFDVAQSAGTIRARTCVIETVTLDSLTAAFAATSVPLDGLLPAAAALARQCSADAPHAMHYDEHLTLRLLSADGPVWSTLRLATDSDVLAEFELACERASRALPVDKLPTQTPLLLSLGEAIAVPADYRQPQLGGPVRSAVDTTQVLEGWAGLALEVVRSSPYLFGSRRRQSNPLASLPISASPRLMIAAAMAAMCLAVGSWMSLLFKRQEAESYKATAEAVFARAFPNQTPSSNVVKQARTLMGGGEIPGAEHVRNPGLMATMENIQRAMPSAGAATIEKIDIVGTTWNLAGLCTDFSCVDALKAGLEKSPTVGEVKVNSAKQGLNKDKIKFSLTVKGKEAQKAGADE